jgi:hypothetical protein
MIAENDLHYLALAAVTLILIKWGLDWVRQRRRAKGAAVAASAGENGMDLWRKTYRDPLRWACLGPGGGLYLANTDRTEVFENDICALKFVTMHKPTHERWREKTGEYPCAWHMAGRRRMWEIRIQMRLKKVPENKISFGVVLGQHVPTSGISRQVQNALIHACSVVGGIYNSQGDDPARTEGELEPPTFALPIWAFDQFVVSDPGEEPDLVGNLEGLGMRRTDGIRDYITAFKDVEANLSTDKVYTFCIWGISQFLDVINWQVCGLLPGVRLNVSKLAGPPPVYIQMYELPGVKEEDVDRRHLDSRKKHYFNVALWSEVQPPSPATRKHLLKCADTDDLDEEPSKKAMVRKTAMDLGGLLCCVGRSGAHMW